MFVFPAFDSNYKTRKRTFKCCQHCRIKRIKCEITSINYEKVGCRNCYKNKLNCDLIRDDSSSESGSRGNKSAEVENNDKIIQRQSTEDLSLLQESNPDPFLASVSLQRKDMTKINAQFLKKTFNFNVSDSESSINYEYLFYGHPNAVIANDTTDSSIWHESGVVVDLQKRQRKKREYNPIRKQSSFGDEENHIRDERFYKFLVSFHAFTLDSPDYPFLSFEIEKLVKLYFLKINSIFPIVHEDRFWKDYNDDKVQTVLIYAIILAISRDHMAENILRNVFRRGKGKDGDLSDEEFHEILQSYMSDLEFKIRQIILILPQLGDNDKIIRLLVSLLLHLHCGFHKLGCEISSHDLTDSLNIALSLGIHMKSKTGRIELDKLDYLVNLWWVCFVFDRFNAVVNSRSIFVPQEDFNLELPYQNLHLLKMVQTARTVENMTSAIYRPFDDAVIGVNFISRYKKFNIEEFKRIEFETVSKDKQNARDTIRIKFDTIEDIESNHNLYVEECVCFLLRILNNLIVLVSQKANYDNLEIPNDRIDLVTLKASSNILWYIQNTDDSLFINIPLIPFCLSIAMAVSLKRKVMSMYSNTRDPLESFDNYTWKNYITELEQYSSKWRNIEEICYLSKETIDQLGGSVSKRAESNNMNNEVQGNMKRRRIDNERDVNMINKNYNIDGNYKLNGFDSQSHQQKEPLTESNSMFDLLSSNSRYHTEITTSHAPELPITTISDTEKQYENYFNNMHVDLFDNDFFEDLHNVVYNLNV